MSDIIFSVFVTGKPENGEPEKQKVYIEIESDIRKISAVHNLIEILKPQKFYIAVKNFEEKSEEVKKCLLDVMGNSLQQKFQEWSLFCNEPSGDTEESLLISFDGICSESLVPAVRLTVMLSTAQEREMLGRMGVEEPSASSFIHFHGCK